MEKNGGLVGIITTRERYTSMGALPLEEREKYVIIRELPSEYENKTFEEIARYLIKERPELSSTQIELAKKIESYLNADPTENICVFWVLRENGDEYAPICDENGRRREFGLQEKIAQYIDQRKTADGTEYRCIDLVTFVVPAQGSYKF